MKELLTNISIAAGIISVVIIVMINTFELKRLRREDVVDRAKERNAKLGEHIENSPFGIKVLEKLDDIAKSQDAFSKSLLHMLRADLLSVTDEILYINRKRGTKSSKWHVLGERLRRFEVLEEVLDDCFMSYKRLGGNHYIEDRYKECKAIIKETQRQAEQ